MEGKPGSDGLAPGLGDPNLVRMAKEGETMTCLQASPKGDDSSPYPADIHNG